MSVIYKHLGSIKNGKVRLRDVRMYKANLEALEGKDIFITVQESVKNTTPDQQRYLRGVVYGIALQDESFGGWSKDEIHEYYCNKFLSKVITKEIKGEVHEFRITKSTSSISVKKMTEFIERVKLDLLEEHQIEIKEIENYV